jgi:hypothetical protein
MLGFRASGRRGGRWPGVEADGDAAKGQVRAVPANDMPARRAFVHQAFGLAV